MNPVGNQISRPEKTEIGKIGILGISSNLLTSIADPEIKKVGQIS